MAATMWDVHICFDLGDGVPSIWRFQSFGCRYWFCEVVTGVLAIVVRVWFHLLAGNASVMEDDGSWSWWWCVVFDESSLVLDWIWMMFLFPNWLFSLGVKFRLAMKMVKDIEFISRGWLADVKVSALLLIFAEVKRTLVRILIMMDHMVDYIGKVSGGGSSFMMARMVMRMRLH